MAVEGITGDERESGRRGNDLKPPTDVRRITEDGTATGDRSGTRRSPIATKFNRRSSDNYLRPHVKFQPDHRKFYAYFKNKIQTLPRARASAVGLGTDNDENRQLTTDASFENWRQRRCRCNADDAHDAMMMRQIK